MYTTYILEVYLRECVVVTYIYIQAERACVRRIRLCRGLI